MTRQQLKEVVLTPAVVWAVIVAGVAFACVYANMPHWPLKPAVTLLVAAIQAVLSVLMFMRLDSAPPMVRLAAVAGPLWLALLFIFSFADYLTRAYPL